MDSLFDQARSAPPEALSRRLGRATLPYLEGALANTGLTPAHVVLLLRNPSSTAAIIQKIGRDPEWRKVYDVRAAIVLNPRTPRALAMNLVSFLWWRDLVRVVDHAVLAPSLRRMAERLIGIRLQEMALGQRISLARMASRGVINSLRRDDSPMVIRALLQNPRFVEEDAVAIARHAATPAAILRAVSEEPRWSYRPAVRKAIARNPATPAAVALRLLHQLGRNDLRELTRSPRVPGLVKVAAQRLLEKGRSVTAERSSSPDRG